MTDLGTLRAWIEALGLQVRTGTAASAPEELWVTPPHDAEPRLVLRAREPGTFEIVHDHRVSASTLGSQWQAPWDTDAPAATLAQAGRQLAGGYPLVEADTSADGDDVVVRLRAPVFADGLTRQGLGLTVSSVLKAAQSLQLLIAGRAEQLAAWNDYQGSLDQHREEQRALVDQMKTGPPPADATVPVATAPTASPGAAAWAPTHTLRRPAQAWAQPNAALASVATIDQHTEVQVLERYGDWTRVLCSNGWSGWIDGRDLRAR